MNDLRDDPNAHADERTHYDLPTVKAMDPSQLRTFAMPDLRSPAARTLDMRTFDQQVIAELVRIVDVVQALALRVDLLEGERDKIDIGVLTQRLAAHAEQEKRERHASAPVPEPDWSKAPRWCCWWAVDEDGAARWFGPQPVQGKHWWYVDQDPRLLSVISVPAGTVELNGYDWRQTLRCKPGFVP